MNKIFVYCACGLIVPLGRWRVVRMRPEMRRSDWSSAHISGRPRQTKKNLKANSKNHYKTIQREKIREIDENNEKSAVLVSPGFSDFGIFF